MSFAIIVAVAAKATAAVIAWSVVQTVVVVASFMYQRAQAKKARRAREAAADANKGFQITQRGEAISLPIVYGRALVAGVRVYANTFNSVPNVGVSGFTTFINGLSGSNVGKANQFLITQQAICIGGINRVLAVHVNETDSQDEKFSFGQRIHVHLDGGVVDPYLTNRDAERSNAKFTGAAYATGVFKLNRDEPQYQGIPDMQFFVEGLKVHTIDKSGDTYSLSASRVYSNNPAYCLLDLLTTSTYGKGIPIADIDLKSFWISAQVCDVIVESDKSLDGVYWNAAGLTRDIKLYELNIAFDSKASLRENIEEILTSMGDGDLFWSAGKFVLNVSYPLMSSPSVYEGAVLQAGSGSNTHLYRSIVPTGDSSLPPGDNIQWERVDVSITDDDIIYDETLTTTWPTAQTRLNHLKVSFINEAEDFKEDSVEWPVKGSSVHNTYMTEDSGIALESSQSIAFVSDYYHALAFAEQEVRMSRSQVMMRIGLNLNSWRLQPGDFIHINSAVLNVPGELAKIRSIEFNQAGFLQLEVEKFDAAHLAWNAKDDEVVEIRNIYDFSLPQVTNLSYSTTVITTQNAIGELSWTPVDDIRVSGYTIFSTTTLPEFINENTAWSQIGFVTGRRYGVTDIPQGSYTLAVAPTTRDNKFSPEYNSITGSRWTTLRVGAGITRPEGERFFFYTVYQSALTQPATPVGGVFNFSKYEFTSLPAGGWTILPPLSAQPLWKSDAIIREDGASVIWSEPLNLPLINTYSALTKASVAVTRNVDGVNVGYQDAKSTLVAILNGVDITTTNQTGYAVVSTENVDAVVNNIDLDPDKGLIEMSNLVGASGLVYVSVTYGGNTFYHYITVQAFVDNIAVDLTPPPKPLLGDFTVSVGFGVVFIDLNVIPNFTEGRGYSHTNVYYTDTLAEDATTATYIDTFRSTPFSLPASDNTERALYFAYVSKDGIESPLDSALSQYNATTPKAPGIAIGHYYGNASAALWSDAQALAAVDSATGNTPLEKDVVTLRFGSTWAQTRMYLNGLWVVLEGTITGELIVAASIGASEIAAGTITAGSAIITNGAIDNLMIKDSTITTAKVQSLSAVKITTGTIAAGNEILVGGRIKIHGDGWIESFSVAPQSYAADFARLTSGNLEVFKWVPARRTQDIPSGEGSAGLVSYKSLTRVETGVAENGVEIEIPGYWTEEPNIIVSMADLKVYSQVDSAVDQSISVRATNIYQTVLSPPSKIWRFTPVATLVLSDGAGSVVLNTHANGVSSNDVIETPYKTTPANCVSVQPYLQIRSYRGTGTNPVWNHRQFRWRLLWNHDGAGDDFQSAWTSWVSIGATRQYVNHSTSVSFPTTGDGHSATGIYNWRVQMQFQDGGTTWDFGETYNYDTVTVSNNSVSALVSAYAESDTDEGPSVDSDSNVITHTLPTYTPPGIWEVYHVNYVWEYSGYAIVSNSYGGTWGRLSTNQYSIVLDTSQGQNPTGDPDDMVFFGTQDEVDGWYNPEFITMRAEARAASNQWAESYGRVRNAVATIYIREQINNSLTPQNDFYHLSYDYLLESAEALAEGTVNYIAVGD
jgi:hypothetical protein